MKRQGNKSANYLDFIPLHCASLRCTVDEMGNVTLFQENKGVFHFLAQKILKSQKFRKFTSMKWEILCGH